MKRGLYYIAAALLVTGIFQACKTKQVALEMHTVRFLLTETSDYCGGAAPPEDLLKVLETPRPMRERSFALHTTIKGTQYNPVVHINNPDTVLNLPYGEYEIFPDAGEEPNWPKEWEDCMQTYYNTPIGKFSLTKGMTEIKLNVHFTCNPCGEPAP